MATDAELQAIADGTTSTTTTQVDATKENTTVDTTTTRQPVSFKDDDLVELTIDGQKVTKTFKEARDGWQRHEDYTRKSQDVAAKVKEIKELYDGLTAKNKELLTKEQAIDAVLGRTPQKAAGPGDDEVVPLGTVRSTVAEMLKTERESLNKALSEEFQKTAEQQTFARWEEKITDHVERLTKEHPVLARIPNLVGTLKREALQDRPQSEAEMLAAVVKAGKRVAKDIDDDYSERRKQDDIKRKQLRENGPEPKGGQTSFKAPEKSYVKGRKIDWDNLEKDVIAAVEGMED